MRLGTTRLDGSVITEFDIIESIRDIKSIKKVNFLSWLTNRKQIDFTYDSNLGVVECSTVKEGERYSCDLKFENRYYKVNPELAADYFKIIIDFIENNKFK